MSNPRPSSWLMYVRLRPTRSASCWRSRSRFSRSRCVPCVDAWACSAGSWGAGARGAGAGARAHASRGRAACPARMHGRAVQACGMLAAPAAQCPPGRPKPHMGQPWLGLLTEPTWCCMRTHSLFISTKLDSRKSRESVMVLAPGPLLVFGVEESGSSARERWQR